ARRSRLRPRRRRRRLAAVLLPGGREGRDGRAAARRPGAGAGVPACAREACGTRDGAVAALLRPVRLRVLGALHRREAGGLDRRRTARLERRASRSAPRRRHRAHQRHSRRLPSRSRSGAHACRVAGARPLPRARARARAAEIRTAGGLPRFRDRVPRDPALCRHAALPAGALPVVAPPRGRARSRPASGVPRGRPERSAAGVRALAARGAPSPARADPGVVALRVQSSGRARRGAARARRRDRGGAGTAARPPSHRARARRPPGFRRVVLAQAGGAGAGAVDRLRRSRPRERRRRGIDGPRQVGPGRVRVGGGGNGAPPRAARVLRPRHARAARAAPRAPSAAAGSPPHATARTPMTPNVVLEGKINDGDLARAVFYPHGRRDGLRRSEVKGWAPPATALDVTGAEILFAVAGIGWRCAVLRIDACLASLNLDDGLVTARIAHRHEHEMTGVLARLRLALPEAGAVERTVPVTFWAWNE